MKNKKGFSLIEVLITMIIVGVLSSLCGMMLIFAYSMFEKVMGNGTASIEYKTFRLRTERIFRNMTKAGPILGDIIVTDNVSSEEERIKFDIEYVNVDFNEEVFKRKYNEAQPSGTTTKYKVSSSLTDPGTWDGHVGRSVSLYSCVEKEKVETNYRRYLMRMEVDEESGNRVVALYTWFLINNEFVVVENESDQYDKFDMDEWKNGLAKATREVLLSDVKDFQVTTWLSNFYPNRIRDDGKYEKYAKIGVVRLYLQLGKESDSQYSNDMIFANKSIYGDLDSFFTTIQATNVVA